MYDSLILSAFAFLGGNSIRINSVAHFLFYTSSCLSVYLQPYVTPTLRALPCFHS
jgi:hypothetical protein